MVSGVHVIVGFDVLFKGANPKQDYDYVLVDVKPGTKGKYTLRNQEFLAAALISALAFTTIQAGVQTEPLSGQPAQGAKPLVRDSEAQGAYQ